MNEVLWFWVRLERLTTVTNRISIALGGRENEGQGGAAGGGASGLLLINQSSVSKKIDQSMSAV